MSTDLELESGNRSFADVIAPLLKEYSARLQEATEGLMSRAKEFAVFDEKRPSPQRDVAARLLDVERQRVFNLLPGIERLARQTSQQLDHGVLDELSRIELEARLADLEGLLKTAKQATNL